ELDDLPVEPGDGNRRGSSRLQLCDEVTAHAEPRLAAARRAFDEGSGDRLAALQRDGDAWLDQHVGQRQELREQLALGIITHQPDEKVGIVLLVDDAEIGAAYLAHRLAALIADDRPAAEA